MANKSSGYGVTVVRGPVVDLEPHPDACETADALFQLASSLREAGKPLAADLFCGAGGMSLGLRDAGFEVLVGVDNDAEALATHASLFAGMHLNWDLGKEDHVEDLSELLAGAGVNLIAGGPPCQPFSKAGRSLIRDLVRTGRRPPEDQRRDLWQSFLAVIERVLPDAVLMENVPDMALEQDMLILRTMVDELERLGYSVEVQVVETSLYGVPQHRQRLILVALRDGRAFDWPHESWGENPPMEALLRDAVCDLPDVEPGWRSSPDGPDWIPYGGPLKPFQVRAREHVDDADAGRIYDHITRPVRDDDLEAFRLLTSDMKYSDLPEDLKRYRDDIFDDKYKRLNYDELSRTITAHIAKDGYWYIHPEFHRTLTVREAARVQTFRDDVRFSGPPTTALKQIGNAVPPLLAEQLGKAVLEAADRDVERAWSTREVSGRLAKWMQRRRRTTLPWLYEPSRWCIIQAEMLLHRARPDDVLHVWPVIQEHFVTPSSTLERADVLRRLGRRLDRGDRAEAVLGVAGKLVEHPQLIDSHGGLVRAGVPAASAAMACRLRPTEADDPVVVTAPVLRVVSRFHGKPVDLMNKRSDGRVALARLVGVDEPGGVEAADRVGHWAHLALIEIGASVCLPQKRLCSRCPLNEWCADSEEGSERTPPRARAKQGAPS